MKIFITGANGFAGSFLVDELLKAGHQVTGLVHAPSSHLPSPQHESFLSISGDLRNAGSVMAAVEASRPDVLYHLAGQASPAQSWVGPASTMELNITGTIYLLEAARAVGLPRVVIVSSAEIYGGFDDSELPITEESLPRPRDPYGISKLAVGHLARIYWERYQLPVVDARPFNHIGPRQATGFVVPDFASQLAAIELGQQKPRIMVGNLSAERDFTDVRDVARAYQLLAEHGNPGQTYFICSGRPRSVENLLHVLIELSGLEVEIATDPERMRPADVPRLFGSNSKIRDDAGWQPSIELRQSLADTLAYWIEHLAK